jgi:Pyruvate/2-oxoacid:ferredoxin oxidoreductase delta subunit
MSESSENIRYQPSQGLSYEPSEAVYWEPAALRQEVFRTFEICHGCRLCFKYCDVFPSLFELVDTTHDGDVRRITDGETERLLGVCFQCKLCEVQCPYTRREGHAFQLDFPALVHTPLTGRGGWASGSATASSATRTRPGAWRG